MSVALDILEGAAKVGVEAARAWLGDQAVMLTDDLVGRLERALTGLLERGPGVVNAKVLVVRDERGE